MDLYIYTQTKIIRKNSNQKISNHTTTHAHTKNLQDTHRGKLTVGEIQNHSNTHTHTHIYIYIHARTQRQKHIKYQ